LHPNGLVVSFVPRVGSSELAKFYAILMIKQHMLLMATTKTKHVFQHMQFELLFFF